jgi:hypothetical protein
MWGGRDPISWTFLTQGFVSHRQPPKSKRGAILGPAPGKKIKQIVIGMLGKEFLDSLAIDRQSLFNSKEPTYEAHGQQALVFEGRGNACEFAGVGEYLHPARALISAPKPATVQEILPSTLAGVS